MTLLETLRNRLAPDDLPWVCAALQEIPALWHALEDGSLPQALPADPRAWTPAALALHALEYPPSLRQAPDTPAGSLPSAWDARADQALRRHLEQQPPEEPPLPHAALVALALRRRLQRGCAWGVLDGAPAGRWQLPLAVLASLLDDPGGLYRALLPRPALHEALWPAFLSQPAPPERQQETLRALLTGLPPLLLPAALTSLHQRRPALADALLPALRPALETLPLERYRCQMQALPWLEPAAAPPSVSGAAPLEESLAALRLLERGALEQAAALLAPQDGHPVRLSAQAALALARGEREAARSLARRALQAVKEAECPPQICLALAETLLALDDALSAEYLLARARRRRPADAALLRLHAEAQRRAAQARNAVRTARLACALAPEDLPTRRTLAAALEDAAAWQEALRERQAVLQRAPDSPADHYALGMCALRAGNLALARQAAEEALQRAPDDSSSHTLLGRVHAALGEEVLAVQHFRQAARLAPHHPEAWLELAALARRRGDLPAALETLRAAAQAAPQAAQVHLELGRACLSAESPAQALPALQEAARLAGLPLPEEGRPAEEVPPRLPAPLTPLMADTAAALGAALAALGRPAQAAPYLRAAYRRDPSDAGTARAYARVLLALQRFSQAASVLEGVLAARPAEAAPYLEYARALLPQDGHAAAEEALQTALRLEPENPQAHALLAEVHAQKGAYPQALEHYRAALHSPLGQHPDWQVRLALGFAYVSLETGEPENAIATLQAALHRHPDHERLQHALYEAYRKAGLQREAREQLEALFPLYADTPASLLWLAEEARRMEHPALAERALEGLRAAPPQDADTLARWGMLYARSQAPEQAARIFARLIADPHTPPALLQRAGESLLRSGYPAEAIPPLEAARQRALDSAPPALWESLSEAYRRNGQPQAALQVVAAGLQAHPAAVALLRQAARLHLHAGAEDAALQYLEAAVTHDPQDAETRRLLLEAHRSRGDLPAAYHHARWLAARAEPDDAGERQAACALAASLACELFDFEAARALLESCPQAETPPEVLALRAEISLHFDEEVGAAQALQEALRLAPQEPRLLALQARLLQRQNAPQEAARLLRRALEACPQPEEASLRRALGLAALRLDDLDAAASLLEPLAAEPNRSPWGALLYVQALTLRAEQRALAQALDMRLDAPPEADAPAAQQALEALRACLEGQGIPYPEQLRRWERRARLVFSPAAGEELCEIEALPPEEAAACLMARRRAGASPPVRRAALGGRASASPLVWLQLALALEAHAPAEALQAAERAATLAPSRAWRWYAAVRYLQARLHAASRVDKALSALEAALALRPEELAWRRAALRLAHECGAHAAAVQHAEALRRLEALSSQDGLLLAQAQRSLGNPAAAIETLTALTAAAPQQQVEAWRLLAELHASREAWGESARCAERVLALAPGDAAALRLRVQAALHLGDGRAARLRAEALVQAAPEEAEAWDLLARAWQTLERPREALSAMRQALSLRKQPPLEWHLRFTEMLAAAEGPEAALEALIPLLNLHPEAHALLRLAVRLSVQAGAETEALRLAQRALQNGAEALPAPLRAELHLTAGRILQRGGHLDQAVHHLSQAVEHAPQEADAWLELGLAYEARRQHRRAVEAYERACALSPDDPRPHQLAGMAYKALKEYPQAERAIRRAAALAPADVHLQRLLASLTALNVVHAA